MSCRESRTIRLVLTALVVLWASSAVAQWGDPFARLEYGVKPGCPFDCDSVVLWLEGDLTSTNWTGPVLLGWERAGDQINVSVEVEFNPDPALPVLVPFELPIPLGLLPEGAYEVTYTIYVNNPIATMPTVPILTVKDYFRVAPPGDQTCDGFVNVLDLISLIDVVFAGSPPPDPFKRADVDCNGQLDIADIIHLIDFIFFGGDICDPCLGYAPLPFVLITNQPPDSLKRDSFELMAAEIAGDTLKLTIAHGGGCMEHSFAVFMSPAMFVDPVPRQASLYPQHTDPGDPCDAWVIENLRFDLRPVAFAYFLRYHNFDDIMLSVYAYDQASSISVLYHP